MDRKNLIRSYMTKGIFFTTYITLLGNIIQEVWSVRTWSTKSKGHYVGGGKSSDGPTEDMQFGVEMAPPRVKKKGFKACLFYTGYILVY